MTSIQNADGGWGYAAGETSIVEATAAAVLALDAAAQPARNRTVNWLLAAQHRDGGWGINAEDDESGWQTAWALLALARAGAAVEALDRAAAWLLAVEVAEVSDDELQRNLREVFAYDPTLRGWPWQPGEATWVEPTALAILALTERPPSPAVEARLAEAARYLQDRRCQGGGWNVGNPAMFDALLPPRAHPTAWALLALARVRPDAIAAGDRAALEREMALDDGAQALAWGSLALQALNIDAGPWLERLAARQAADGSWDGSPYTTAVAILAGRGAL